MTACPTCWRPPRVFAPRATAAVSRSVGSVALSLVPLVLLVGWARVALQDHTPAQALAGAALGALVAASVFSLLR
jgi:membrane-associated phospholipid phosphatase